MEDIIARSKRGFCLGSRIKFIRDDMKFEGDIVEILRPKLVTDDIIIVCDEDKMCHSIFDGHSSMEVITEPNVRISWPTKGC